MIRSPAPGFVGHPSPAPVRFVDPAAIAVWRPIRPNRGHPDWAVIRSLAPFAALIEILTARVIRIGVLEALSVRNCVVAIVIKAVPIVVGRSGGHAILGLIGAALDGDH